jgi:hypothetical protein
MAILFSLVYSSLNNYIMSNSDFIPRPDAEFNVWQGNLVSLIEGNTEAWGIPAEDFTALTAGQTAWTTAFTKASNKQNRSAADVRAKDDARELYEKSLRTFVAQWLASNSKVTDSDRERMNITVRSAVRTPVSVPVTTPVGTIDFSVRQQHSLYFVDSATNGKAKPEGVHGCEIWMKNGGEAPKTDADFSYVGIDTKSPYVISFTVSDIGKLVYYRMRWINKRGQTGPWSSTISAVVGG